MLKLCSNDIDDYDDVDAEGKLFLLSRGFYSRKLTYRSKLIWREKHFFIMINIGLFVRLIMRNLAQ